MSIRDGRMANAFFEKGVLTEYREEKCDSKQTGTVVEFIPDVEIFKEGIELDTNLLRKQLQELAFLSPGLKFVLCINSKCEEISSKNGLLDYLDYLSKDKDVLTSKFLQRQTRIESALKLLCSMLMPIAMFISYIQIASQIVVARI